MAHRFAAALLVPADAARQELGEKRRHLAFTELGVLKEKYGLSMQAWIRRAKDLEIISESVYKSLCIQFSSKGWRKREPVRVPRARDAQAAQADGRARRRRGHHQSRRGRPHLQGLWHRFPGRRSAKMEDSAMKPTELLRLPRERRLKVLAEAAACAEKEYRTDQEPDQF